MIRPENLLIISGPSGVGKSTLVKRLMEDYPEVREEVSCTTRPIRPGETDGVEYHFIFKEEFLRRNEAGDFFETSEYNGNLYGSEYSELEEKTNYGNLCVTILDVPGARKVKEEFPAALAIFITASLSVLEKRLRGRGTDSEDVIQRRLQSATSELDEAVRMNGTVYNHVFSSTTVGRGVYQLTSLWKAIKYLPRTPMLFRCPDGLAPHEIEAADHAIRDLRAQDISFEDVGHEVSYRLHDEKGNPVLAKYSNVDLGDIAQRWAEIKD